MCQHAHHTGSLLKKLIQRMWCGKAMLGWSAGSMDLTLPTSMTEGWSGGQPERTCIVLEMHCNSILIPFWEWLTAS